ncbi:MAG: hypothetical protein AAF517_08640 [Planctomycetota bacterium]
MLSRIASCRPAALLLVLSIAACRNDGLAPIGSGPTESQREAPAEGSSDEASTQSSSDEASSQGSSDDLPYPAGEREDSSRGSSVENTDVPPVRDDAEAAEPSPLSRELAPYLNVPEASDLRAQTYRDVHLEMTSSLRVESASEGGLRLFFDLDPKHCYRIEVLGTPSFGASELMIRRDGGRPSARAFTSEAISFHSWGHTTLELLIHAREPFSLTLDSLVVDGSASNCKCDDDLKEQILSDVVGLDAALSSNPLDALALLRDWSANASDSASLSEIEGPTLDWIIASSASSTYYDVYRANLGGSYCGGMAAFFDKVLRLFGFHSMVIDFGSLEHRQTHVTVIVGFETEVGIDFYVFDPTFNFAPVDATTRAPIELRQLLDLEVPFEIEEMDLDDRDFYYRPEDSPAAFEVVEERDEYSIGRLPGYGVDYYLTERRRALEESGFSGDRRAYTELLRKRVFTVRPCRLPHIRDALLELFDEYEIPYGLPEANDGEEG